MQYIRLDTFKRNSRFKIICKDSQLQPVLDSNVIPQTVNFFFPLINYFLYKSCLINNTNKVTLMKAIH